VFQKPDRFPVGLFFGAVDWLIEQGVPFTRDDDGYHLTREGGHSARRVIHVADTTGLAVQTTLSGKVRQQPNITVFENHIAVDLITGAKLGTRRAALSRRLRAGQRQR
jgi:L-aspartate oxidase